MHHSLAASQGAPGGVHPDPMPMIAQGTPLLGGIDGTTAIIVIAVAVVLIAVLFPIARAIAKRMEQRGPSTAVPAGNSASDARLQRLEQSVEAMEVKLERISEGQRYTTKLLTERLPLAARVPQPGQGERTLL